MNDYSTLLYARPGFWEGVARAFDIGGTFDGYNESPSPEEADEMAFLSDWYAIGADLQGAMACFEAEAGSARFEAASHAPVDPSGRERCDAVAHQSA